MGPFNVTMGQKKNPSPNKPAGELITGASDVETTLFPGFFTFTLEVGGWVGGWVKTHLGCTRYRGLSLSQFLEQG